MHYSFIIANRLGQIDLHFEPNAVITYAQWLYILAMLIWTLIFSEKYVGIDFMPRWTGDLAWVAIVIGMIILYGLPFIIKKRHRS